MSKPAIALSVLVFVVAASWAYLARTDAFAIIAWIVLAALAWGAIGMIYGLDKALRQRKARVRVERP